MDKFKLHYIELSHSDAYLMWVEFKDAIGEVEMKKIFGNYWPRSPVSDERIWATYDEKLNRVGWCALRLDPVDPVVWQISGVFPEFRELGYMKSMFKFCIKTTFHEWPNVEAMFYSISKSNPSFIEYRKKSIEKQIVLGDTFVGEINIPSPGYVIFAIVRREEQK